jgi:hypothetical protein
MRPTQATEPSAAFDMLKALWIFHFLVFVCSGLLGGPEAVKAYVLMDREAVFRSVQEPPSTAGFNYSKHLYKPPKSIEELSERMNALLVRDIALYVPHVIASFVVFLIISKRLRGDV